MKVYAYRNCSSCKKAIKWLQARGIEFEEVPIREKPPGVSELKRMYEAHGENLKPLFNTAGADYREMGMKDRLPAMMADEAFELLSTKGNLVKRPFVIGDGVALTGLNEEVWEEAFSSLD